MTAENVMGAQIADRECRDSGYKPELKRTLGSFQVFAISFAFISMAVGIFGTYDDVLRDAGPARDPALLQRHSPASTPGFCRCELVADSVPLYVEEDLCVDRVGEQWTNTPSVEPRISND